MYAYTHITCIATNKYASRALEYNIYIYIYMCLCVIMRNNATYEPSAYWIIYRHNTKLKLSCDTLVQYNIYIYNIYIYNVCSI